MYQKESPLKLRLAHKMISLYMVMALIVLITGTIGIFSISKVSRSTEELLVVRAEQLKQALLMKTTLQECRVNLFEAATVENDVEEFSFAREEFEMKFDRLSGYINILLEGNTKLKLPKSLKGSTLSQKIESIKPVLNEYKSIATKLLDHKQNLVDKGGASGIASTTDPELSKLVRTDMWEMTDKLTVLTDDLIMIMSDQMANATTDIQKSKENADITFMIAIACGILVAIILGVATTRSLTGKLSLVVGAIKSGSAGDLTSKVNINSADEFGDLAINFNQMSHKLSEMISNTRNSIFTLIDITSNTHSAISNNNTAVEVQSRGINETSSSIIEITASINQVAQAMDYLTTSATESSSATLELVGSINSSTENIEQLGSSVEEVSSSIIEMNSSIHEIDSGITKVVESTILTAQSIASLDMAISRVKGKSNETARITSIALKDAESGWKSVQDTITGMDQIKISSIATSEVMNELNEKTSQIGQIVSVIDEIAEQTNLLALNAAIIASQAGEHGKGFSVVASEIKDLADRTRKSTQEIAVVIKGVQHETILAVDTLETAISKVNAGEELSHNSGQALQKIVEGVNTASLLIKEVLTLAEEQSHESGRIRKAIDQVTDMVSQISRATNEQGKSGVLIEKAAEDMRILNNQVRVAANEQKKTGEGISTATEKILEMIQQINKATTEQNSSSKKILNAVQNIQSSATVTIDSNTLIEESMNKLTEQVENLSEGIKIFKVSSTDN